MTQLRQSTLQCTAFATLTRPLQMHSHADQVRLLHRTTIALSQLHRLLQQATDILSNLHSFYLVHTPSPFPPPPLRATRRLLLPSNMHHRNLLLPKHPRLLLHHHYSHNPSANVSLHHPSTKMRIGMLGTLMQIPALSSSKLILVSARTGTTLPVE